MPEVIGFEYKIELDVTVTAPEVARKSIKAIMNEILDSNKAIIDGYSAYLRPKYDESEWEEII